MKEKIEIYDSGEKLAESVAKIIQQKTIEKQKRNEQLFIALSGGNTPKILFELLANQYKKTINWNSIRFYWVDERCVPPNDDESNFGVVKSLLFNNIEIYGSRIERMQGENEPHEEAFRYMEILSSQLPSKNSVPSFDLILLGMGDDGHTASIFPNQPHLLNSDKLCEVSEHPISGQKRITLTTKTINNAAEIIFLVTGEKKAQIIKEILKQEDNYLEYPSAHIQPTWGELTWMLDKEAAQFL